MNQLKTQDLISFLKGKPNKHKLFSMPRFKRTAAQRLLKETHLNKTDIITRFFLACDKEKEPYPVDIIHNSKESLLDEVQELYGHGFQSFFLSIPSFCTEKELSLLSTSIYSLKSTIPDLNVFADISFAPSIFCENAHPSEDQILIAYSKAALVLAKSGIDFITSGDTIDGRVKYLRNILDKNHFSDVGIIAKTAVFHSSFQEKTQNPLHTINLANKKQILLKAKLDEKEHSDIILLSPSLLSLDVLGKIQEKTLCTIAIEQTTTEYAMILSAQEKNILDAKQTFFEAFLTMKRAGADLIFTPATKIIKNMF